MSEAGRGAGLFDALFAPLDAEVRQEFGIGREARAAAEAPEEGTPLHAVPTVVQPARPNAPQTPWQFTRDDWLAVAKRTVSQISEDRVSSVAGGVTFFGLLAMFPALTAIVSLYGVFAEPGTIAGHLDMLERFLPASALDIIRSQVVAITSAPGTALSIAGVFALLMAFYSATGGMKAMIEALNIAFFKTETRGFIKLNLLAMGLTIGGMILVIAMIGVIAVIPIVLEWLPLPGGTEWAVTILRWPLMFAVLMLALAAVYRFGPNKPDSRWEWISPGATLATLGLVIASMLFSWYAANLTDFNETYGSLGAVIGLMMWLWIASMVVLVGAELNSEVERHLKLVNGVPVPGDPVADETQGAPRQRSA